MLCVVRFGAVCFKVWCCVLKGVMHVACCKVCTVSWWELHLSRWAPTAHRGLAPHSRSWFCDASAPAETISPPSRRPSPSPTWSVLTRLMLYTPTMRMFRLPISFCWGGGGGRTVGWFCSLVQELINLTLTHTIPQKSVCWLVLYLHAEVKEFDCNTWYQKNLTHTVPEICMLVLYLSAEVNKFDHNTWYQKNLIVSCFFVFFSEGIFLFFFYKYTCSCYIYIIDKKDTSIQTSIQTKSWTKYFIDRYLPCTKRDWLPVTYVHIF